MEAKTRRKRTRNPPADATTTFDSTPATTATTAPKSPFEESVVALAGVEGALGNNKPKPAPFTSTSTSTSSSSTSSSTAETAARVAAATVDAALHVPDPIAAAAAAAESEASRSFRDGASMAKVVADAAASAVAAAAAAASSSASATFGDVGRGADVPPVAIETAAKRKPRRSPAKKPKTCGDDNGSDEIKAMSDGHNDISAQAKFKDDNSNFNGNSNSNSKKGQIQYNPDVPMTKEQLTAWRREMRRVRNRESAAASRRKVRDRIEELEEEVGKWKKKYEEVMERLEKKKQAEIGATGNAAVGLDGMGFLGKNEGGTAAMGESEE
ncbi:hypothetical protein ACHAXS_001714 [Conticribra weissflogii]